MCRTMSSDIFVRPEANQVELRHRNEDCHSLRTRVHLAQLSWTLTVTK